MFSANQMNTATPTNTSSSGTRSVTRHTRKCMTVRHHSSTTNASSTQRRSQMKWWLKKLT
jgi:hypothetical protein